ncbi:hypothetical protein OH76DRAFT_1397131 [Lentinus brumalis]|uniref:Vacuolar ATPase assembly integral membrane protein VMA21 n=1 Tax=Lentinus brumalis TaxID=2498619 RepID=A0A371DT68_9APHY|nr:hypothetical protein OH76DRAFT_1397131 [Polyporus brumalis]
MSGQAAPGELVAQPAEQQGGVLVKLIIFALALGGVPISAYFLSRDYLWEGNANFAAITAIVSANLVLVAYIIESIREESRTRAQEKQQQPAESKKDR